MTSQNNVTSEACLVEPDVRAAQEAALRFARLHDWGAAAYLNDRGEIAGLTCDWSREDPETGEVSYWTEHCDPWPATIAAMREFGQY